MTPARNSNKLDLVKLTISVDSLEEFQTKIEQLAEMPLRVNHLSVDVVLRSPGTSDQIQTIKDATAKLGANDTELAASIEAAKPK